MAYLNVTSPAYGCTIVWEPTPGPASTPAGSAAPGSSPIPPVVGYIQPDMGNEHVTSGSFVRYLYCPPASGRHYSGSGIGPIRVEAYGPEENARPQGWIHNLEHGGVVILYKCPGPGCDATGQAAHEQLYREWPESPVCKVPARQISPIFARFDDMPWNYAVLAWGVVMPVESFDRQAILDFHAQYAEQFNPEKLCTPPTPTPGPTGTPGPAASPATSPDSSPGGSPAASPAGTVPAESPAPSPS
jgi:Protein of unknown function (DUF3105)